MTSALLRRSSSTFSRRFFTAVTSVESLPHHHHFHSSSSFPRRNDVSGEGARAFHAKPGPLNFHYSLASRAALPAVVHDYEHDDEVVCSANGEEGLEIANLGISREIVDALAKKGIAKPFPIQKAVLEPAMQGHDMIGRARTGTGKTLAFGIPILDKIIQFNANHGLQGEEGILWLWFWLQPENLHGRLKRNSRRLLLTWRQFVFMGVYPSVNK